jgi:hypothetical protein
MRQEIRRRAQHGADRRVDVGYGVVGTRHWEKIEAAARE